MVGKGRVETFVRYEGGGVGGGPAVAYGHPVGAATIRGFVGWTVVTGDSSTKRLTDFQLAPRSGVGGMSIRF